MKKKGLVIADSGPIFSLATINKLELLDEIFDEVKIPKAVWNEITFDKNTSFYHSIQLFFESRVVEISSFNELTFLMDYGESESVILYKELNADFLLIDDKKARRIAENFNINCVGTLGILSTAKEKGLVKDLRAIFLAFLKNERYYSISLMNKLLEIHNEEPLL